MTHTWRRSLLTVAAFVLALIMTVMLVMAASADARPPRMECPEQSDVPALDYGDIRTPRGGQPVMPAPCGPGIGL